jgi:hypothetical protein
MEKEMTAKEFKEYTDFYQKDMADKAKEILRLRESLFEISNLLPINTNILLSRKIENIIRRAL